jgi:hypothetical protein
VNLSGSSSNILLLTNVLAADNGRYSVVVSDLGGSVTSAEATLNVLDPAIVFQPVGATCIFGSTVTFTVTAVGTPPLTYQWFQNETVLRATTPTLTISNVSPADAGGYSVVITNPTGTVTSRSADLALIDLPTLEIALDPSSYPFLTLFGSTGADYAIQVTTNFTDWVNLVTNMAPYTFTDREVGPSARFYRGLYIPSP